MAYDRWLRFPEGNGPPGKDAVEELLLLFFEGTGAIVEWSEDGRRFFIKLPGTCVDTMPFVWRQHGGGGRESIYASEPWERWIELYLDETQFDVMTRNQDDFTHAVANGLVRLAARAFGGSVEQETGWLSRECEIAGPGQKFMARPRADEEWLVTGLRFTLAEGFLPGAAGASMWVGLYFHARARIDVWASPLTVRVTGGIACRVIVLYEPSAVS